MLSLCRSDWSITQIAKSSMPSVRFLNKPTIGAIQNRVFVTIGAGDRERPLKLTTRISRTYRIAFMPSLMSPMANCRWWIWTKRPDSGRAMLDAATGIPDGEFLSRNTGVFLICPIRANRL